MNALSLSNATLASLPEAIARPTYDRTALTPGIVHIGLGNFHRAHQSWYLHRLMQQGAAHDWAILGAGVRPYDAAMRDRLLAQDCLTTLIELSPDATSAEIVGSMIDYLPIEDGNGALIAAMARPEIRIVALTVTEGGYYQEPDAGGFDLGHTDIQHDIANPATPRTAFGAIVAALGQRRAAGHGPFTVQSCDNLQGNGDITRQTVLGLARAINADLADWIDAQCSFPNSMVDCIVPATGPAEIARAAAMGVADTAPVTHEPYRQWVIEDDFCAGRPDWDAVGATFTDAVHAYETMKIRILNAGHQVIANAGELLSCATIADCMRDPDIAALFHKVQSEEIAPYVHPVPEITPTDYVTLIAARFSNAAIHDTTRRVAFDGSSRHTGFILPVLRDALDAGGSISGIALVEALWARMCAGTREDGSDISPNDPRWETLALNAQAARQDPRAWLAQPGLYGDLSRNDRFAACFADWLRMVWDRGTRAALQHYSAR
ncbi:mannitol dehydrogenase family protein [Epibacterium sp. Ofav1-8]|uniref:mannitol dehydrogenase family protein n=1 Tax=Epibacterium sp. Ofav1-8 TaxID=2917735 RepID=UPI001EF4AFEC|nr:mannitol dehydrogenase family protein [Epibacterium sp. Ofav1-8]MCG7624268.1 mannitol dehydrogenase family protein [Epibacterium sp. Ofav1-8]